MPVPTWTGTRSGEIRGAGGAEPPLPVPLLVDGGGLTTSPAELAVGDGALDPDADPEGRGSSLGVAVGRAVGALDADGAMVGSGGSEIGRLEAPQASAGTCLR